jgi:hypothetical protein
MADWFGSSDRLHTPTFTKMWRVDVGRLGPLIPNKTDAILAFGSPAFGKPEVCRRRFVSLSAEKCIFWGANG